MVERSVCLSFDSHPICILLCVHCLRRYDEHAKKPPIVREETEPPFRSGCINCGGYDGAHEAGCAYVRSLEKYFARRHRGASDEREKSE